MKVSKKIILISLKGLLFLIISLGVFLIFDIRIAYADNTPTYGDLIVYTDIQYPNGTTLDLNSVSVAVSSDSTATYSGACGTGGTPTTKYCDTQGIVYFDPNVANSCKSSYTLTTASGKADFEAAYMGFSACNCYFNINLSAPAAPNGYVYDGGWSPAEPYKVAAWGNDNTKSLTFTIKVKPTPTLSVTLSASPSSGDSPLNDVDLTADPGGTATGSTIYRFDCTNNNSWDIVSTNNYDPWTKIDACNYSNPGTYTAKTTITREGINASDTTTITVYPVLTVSKAGTGTGTVTSNPAGINCGSDCTDDYYLNTSVTLTATAAVGSTFAGWSGAGTGTGSTRIVTMNGNKSVTATFNLNQYTLTVSKAGTGTGTVTSNPAGINCGSDCTQNYNYGTSVTLTATSGSCSIFAGWSGACSETGSTCIVSMTQARSVTATFNSSDTISTPIISAPNNHCVVGSLTATVTATGADNCLHTVENRISSDNGSTWTAGNSLTKSFTSPYCGTGGLTCPSVNWQAKTCHAGDSPTALCSGATSATPSLYNTAPTASHSSPVDNAKVHWTNRAAGITLSGTGNAGTGDVPPDSIPNIKIEWGSEYYTGPGDTTHSHGICDYNSPTCNTGNLGNPTLDHYDSATNSDYAKYWWRVFVKDACGAESITSGDRYFTLFNQRPTAYQSSPNTGTSFDWHSAVALSGYGNTGFTPSNPSDTDDSGTDSATGSPRNDYLQIKITYGTDPDGTSCLACDYTDGDINTGETTFNNDEIKTCKTPPLSNGLTYNWKVWVRDIYGSEHPLDVNTNVSTGTRSFTIKNPFVLMIKAATCSAYDNPSNPTLCFIGTDLSSEADYLDTDAEKFKIESGKFCDYCDYTTLSGNACHAGCTDLNENRDCDDKGCGACNTRVASCNLTSCSAPKSSEYTGSLEKWLGTGWTTGSIIAPLTIDKENDNKADYRFIRWLYGQNSYGSVGIDPLNPLLPSAGDTRIPQANINDNTGVLNLIAEYEPLVYWNFMWREVSPD